MEIRTGTLDHPAVVALLHEHLHGMAQLSPPESIHALDREALRGPGLSFWSAWRGEDLLGCAALKELGRGHAEIKSMRTAAAHRRCGVASRLLQHLLDEAQRRGYRRLSLETGAAAGFAAARALYAGFGFGPCGPFAGYREDPNSVFMTRTLDPGPAPHPSPWLPDPPAPAVRGA